jgi:endonuclease/exonuclease/phosphatase family metal-dependent hydrolase
MRLATYNVENLFDRAKVMNLDSWAEGKPVLEDFAELNALIAKLSYDPADKARMATLLVKLGLEKSDTGPFVILRRNKGGLVKRPKTGGVEIVADGRADWVGSLELLDEPIRHTAVLNTARIIAEVDADVLGIVEAEHRPSLMEFNRVMIPEAGGASYRHGMVIDGNDDRGIDVGILTRDGFPIESMCSHVDDRDSSGRLIFSRDCPQYRLRTPSGGRLVVMVNHFKSKGHGTQASSNARRRAQAQRVKEIYESLRADGIDHVAIVGDLNDTPGSAPLQPLIQQTDLKDVSEHPAFDDGGFKGTHGSAGAGAKIDYILLSPALFGKVQQGGVNRRGMWPGVRPAKWPVLAELKRPEDSASDHAALWVDLNL